MDFENILEFLIKVRDSMTAWGELVLNTMNQPAYHTFVPAVFRDVIDEVLSHFVDLNTLQYWSTWDLIGGVGFGIVFMGIVFKWFKEWIF